MVLLVLLVLDFLVTAGAAGVGAGAAFASVTTGVDPTAAPLVPGATLATGAAAFAASLVATPFTGAAGAAVGVVAGAATGAGVGTALDEAAGATGLASGAPANAGAATRLRATTRALVLFFIAASYCTCCAGAASL